MRQALIVIFVILDLCHPSWTAAQVDGETSITIRLGSLATETSTWGKVFVEMDAELRKRTDGRLRFRFYFGRDESDLVEMIRSRRLDAVSLTGAGLAEILPEMSLFQLPMLFATYEELDRVIEGLTPRYSRRFEEEGYALLGWADLGFIHLFSRKPIRTQSDLQKTRSWVLPTDPIARAFAVASGREPVLLPMNLVLASLRQGEIGTVYASPIGCIVLQWHTAITYMTDIRLAAGVAGTVLTTDLLASLPADLQDVLRDVCSHYHRQLIIGVRHSHEDALRALHDNGVATVSVPHQERAKWVRIAQRVQDQFADRLYDRQWLIDARRLLEADRAASP